MFFIRLTQSRKQAIVCRRSPMGQIGISICFICLLLSAAIYAQEASDVASGTGTTLLKTGGMPNVVLTRANGANRGSVAVVSKNAAISVECADSGEVVSLSLYVINGATSTTLSDLNADGIWDEKETKIGGNVHKPRRQIWLNDAWVDVTRGAGEGAGTIELGGRKRSILGFDRGSGQWQLGSETPP